MFFRPSFVFCHVLFWSWQCLYFLVLPLLVTTLLSFGHHFVIFKPFLCLEHASFINWLVKVTLLSINVQCRPLWHSEFKSLNNFYVTDCLYTIWKRKKLSSIGLNGSFQSSCMCKRFRCNHKLNKYPKDVYAKFVSASTPFTQAFFNVNRFPLLIIKY
jgi:hypothetical protein